MGGHLLLLPTAPWTIYVSLDFCAKVFRLKTNYLPYATHTILGNFGVAWEAPADAFWERMMRKSWPQKLVWTTNSKRSSKISWEKVFMDDAAVVFQGRRCNSYGRIVANNLRKNGTFLRSSLLLILINGQGSQIEILKSYLLAPGKRALITQKTSQEKNLALS